MTFGFLVGSRNFIGLFWVSWRDFARVGLLPLLSQETPRHTGDCSAIHFTKNFLICSNQISDMFRSGHDCASTFSARNPRYFRLQADVAIWVLRKVRVDTMLTRTWFHFCSRLHWRIMRRTGSVSISRLRVSLRL